MPTDTVSVATEFAEFATELVKSGRYESAREVLEAAKAALAREKGYREKLAFLKHAVEEGIASGIAEGDVFARVRERAGLPSRART